MAKIKHTSSPLASAKAHRTASSMIFSTRIIKGAETFRKTLAFLFFQSSQEISIRRVAIPFPLGERVSSISVHQCLTLCIAAQSAVTILLSPVLAFTAFQTATENRHWNRRCAADSWTWLQRGHKPQFGHLLRCSLSVVNDQPSEELAFWCSPDFPNGL